MEHSTLYELIEYLKYGTKLYIGVLFFGNYGNDMCTLPRKLSQHHSKICETFKNAGKYGFKRCHKCRHLAIKKAMNEKASFGGFCVNGLYEYTHPVVINGDVACIIYIGNIFCEKVYERKKKFNITEKTHLLSSAEKNFDEEKCRALCRILEGHIRLLLEKYTDKTEKTLPVIKNIKNYIHSNLEFDIDIAQIAEVFHYNVQYLGRLFKKETSVSINEYIMLMRIERAKNMLETSDDAIIEIAGKTGFNTVTYFNRKFKNVVHMTPTEYRLAKNLQT